MDYFKKSKGVDDSSIARSDKKICTGRDLAEAFARTELPAEEAVAWHRDLRTARKTLKSPKAK